MQDVTFHFLLKSGNRRIVIDRQILAHVIRRSEACEMTRMFSDGQRLGSRKFGSDSGFFHVKHLFVHAIVVFRAVMLS